MLLYQTLQPSELLHVVEALQNAKGVFELQHSGDLLVKKVKDVQREKWRNVQDKIAMLKQESLDALRKVGKFFLLLYARVSYVYIMCVLR